MRELGIECNQWKQKRPPEYSEYSEYKGVICGQLSWTIVIPLFKSFSKQFKLKGLSTSIRLQSELGQQFNKFASEVYFVNTK